MAIFDDTRRRFLKLLGLSALGIGCAPLAKGTRGTSGPRCAPPADGEYDFVVVGSGAGGGPLACNLARACHRVLLLEAGGDGGEPPDLAIPALHGKAAEDPAI